MSGTFVGKVLAEGQFANAKGTLYTVPASTVAYIKSFFVFNTNAAAQTVNVYLKPGSTSRQIVRIATLAQYESANILDLLGSVILEAADLIEGDTTTATALDYVITGVEET
jgi:hypothetical protein